MSRFELRSLGNFAIPGSGAAPRQSVTDLWSKRLIATVVAGLQFFRQGSNPPEITKKSSLDLFVLRLPKGA